MKSDIVLGDSTIELSSFMNCLSQDEINSLEHDDDPKIIASGVDCDGVVIFLTQKAEVYSFSPERHHIPSGDYVPCLDGRQVFLPNDSERWPGLSDGFFVSSKWLIDRSEPAISQAHLSVNDTYLGEINTRSSEASDT